MAVVEDFFDIIYAMHVEMGADPGRAPKHAGQKKTYKAVRENMTVSNTSSHLSTQETQSKVVAEIVMVGLLSLVFLPYRTKN